MAFSVEFTPEGVTSLQALSSSVQERILRKLRWLSERFEDITPQALSNNLSGLFKLRVGDYRVIYSFDPKLQIITIHKVGHRREIYD